jgi:hypothetical protein
VIGNLFFFNIGNNAYFFNFQWSPLRQEPEAPLIMRPKLQKQSALKLAGRIIPHSEATRGKYLRNPLFSAANFVVRLVGLLNVFKYTPLVPPPCRRVIL